MAYDKVVDSAQLKADLTSVADKIREKADITDKLEFPNEYLSTLDSLPGVNDVETQMKQVTYTKNGVYFIRPDAEYYALDFVGITVNVPDNADALYDAEYALSNGFSDYSNMFKEKLYMTKVPTGILRNTAKGTNFANMFNFGGLCTEMPQFDVSSGTDFNHMFYGMAEIEIFPSFNTSKGLNFDGMFGLCMKAKTIEGIDLSSATSVTTMFDLCSELENITFNGIIKITGLDLSPCTKLTHDSLMSAINALYDYASEGTTGTFKLILGSTNLAKLTDAEKAIATQKGWTLA